MKLEWSEIKKILNGTASQKEVETFDVWYNEDEIHREQFEKMKNFFEDIENEEYQKNLICDSKRNSMSIIKNAKKTQYVKLLKRTISVAATLVAITFGVNYILTNESPNHEIAPIVAETKIDDIVIKTDDGQVIELFNPKDLTKLENVKVEESNLTYSDTNDMNTTHYHTIYVPRGRNFNLTLSDGTIIHLNSGSELKYPTRFKKGEERKVFLKGEGYFNVAKDSCHQFIVSVKNIGVKVYGTQFNINSYDETIKTTLVEGSIALDLDGVETKVKPGEMALYSPKDKSITLQAVDVQGYVSWVDGYLTFDNERLEVIAQILERNYNVTIIFESDTLKNLVINCNIPRNDSIEQFLNSLKRVGKLHYRQENGKYFLK